MQVPFLRQQCTLDTRIIGDETLNKTRTSHLGSPGLSSIKQKLSSPGLRPSAGRRRAGGPEGKRCGGGRTSVRNLLGWLETRLAQNTLDYLSIAQATSNTTQLKQVSCNLSFSGPRENCMKIMRRRNKHDKI